MHDNAVRWGAIPTDGVFLCPNPAVAPTIAVGARTAGSALTYPDPEGSRLRAIVCTGRGRQRRPVEP